MSARWGWGILLLAMVAPAALASPVRVTDVGPAGLTVEFASPDYALRDLVLDGVAYRVIEASGLPRLPLAGHPDLPFVSVPFAVPPGASIRVTVLDEEIVRIPGPPPPPAPEQAIEGEGDDARPVERRSPDPAFYDSRRTYPALSVEASRAGRLRFQDVGAVSLHPFRYDAAAGELVVSKRLSVRVEWGAPGALPKGMAPAVEDDRFWEPVYKALFPNYEDARAWRARPAARAAAAPQGAARQSGPEWKITVRRTDLYVIGASALEGLPASTPAGDLRLHERLVVHDQAAPYEESDVPIHVVDADEDGLFGAGDSFIFHGRSSADRFPSEDVDTLRYTDRHVYWLSLDGSGARMAEVSGDLGYTGLTPPATYEFWRHLEEDHEYGYQQTAVEQNEPWETRRVRSEHFFWLGPGKGPQFIRFEAPGVDVTGGVGARMRFQGMGSWDISGYEVSVGLANEWSDSNLGEPLPGTPFVVAGTRGGYVFDSQGLTFPAGMLIEGRNQFTYTVSNTGLYFDDMEFGYRRRYEASGDRLDFTGGDAAGASEFRVTKFRSEALLLYDVTDPGAPRRVVPTPAQIVRLGPGNWALTFQDEIGGLRRYVAATEAALGTDAEVRAETAPEVPLWDASRDADYIMIVHDDFFEGLLPLANHRASQGHRVEIVRAGDVYDEFSGGRPTPAGIYRYLRWAMERRTADAGGAPPAYVLLGGDASDDVNGSLKGLSMPNFLPAPIHFSNVVGPNGTELISMDPRYVLNLTSPRGEADWFEDLFLGRLPVGSLEQMEQVVSKIINYESFRPGDLWRGNVLLLSDDTYSSSYTFALRYCYQGGEGVFMEASDDMASDIRDVAGLKGINIIPLYMSAYLDTVPALDRCGIGCCPDYNQTVNYTRSVLTPLVQGRLSQGHLLVTYQGHGNSRLIAHEYLLVHSANLGRMDIDGITNLGKPFVFHGFACHLNEFSRYNESTTGDAFGENLLYASNRGAVGSFASTGYEWLSSNPPIHRAVSKAFFVVPPVTDLPGGGATRWILGPTLTAAKTNVILDNMPTGRYDANMLGMAETYDLLGDPALRMEALPPQFEAEVDGVPYVSGTRLRAAADQDSILIRATIRDELDVRGSTIRIVVDGATVPDTLYDVVAPPATPPAADRGYVVTYRHHPAPDTYDVEISAEDLNGMTGTLRLPVVLDTRFFAGSVPLDASGENAVSPSFTASATVESPVALSAGDFTMRLDGHALEASAEESPTDPGRGWTVRAGVAGLADGGHTLSLRVDNGEDPPVERSVLLDVRYELTMRDVFNFPNPFSDETRFHYTLSRDAARAVIRIFTVSGRPVGTLEGTTFPGRNIVPDVSSPRGWDGRDADGDPVANGLYFYRVEITGLDGSRVETLGRMARAR